MESINRLGYEKVDLINHLGISSSTVAKMTKGKLVPLAVLERICKDLDCNFSDLINYIDQDKNTK